MNPESVKIVKKIASKEWTYENLAKVKLGVLADLSKCPEKSVRVHVALALGSKVGKRAFNLLKKMADSEKNSHALVCIAISLGKFLIPKSFALLKDMLAKHLDVFVVSMAVQSVANFRSKEAFAILKFFAKHKSHLVREGVASGLVEFENVKPISKKALELLKEMLNDKNEIVRSTCVSIISDRGTEEALEILSNTAENNGYVLEGILSGLEFDFDPSNPKVIELTKRIKRKIGNRRLSPKGLMEKSLVGIE